MSLVAASAADLQNATGNVDKPEGALRWTVSVEPIVLERTGGAGRTLVERVPGTEPFYRTFTDTGPAAFNSSQFQQGFSAGPKIGLTYRGDSGYGAELIYFNIFDQGASSATGPDTPADWLVMKAPGSFTQTQDFPYQAMVWRDVTNLYSAEANGRVAVSSRVTVLAGFRWLQLNDALQGTLSPADRTAPTWKQSCSLFNCTLADVARVPGAGLVENYPPFWNTDTTNNLYGLQVAWMENYWCLAAFLSTGKSRPGCSTITPGSRRGLALGRSFTRRVPRLTTLPSSAMPACRCNIRSRTAWR
jgi:hypothetical protein